MSRTIRVCWRERGTGWYNFNWSGAIDQDSVVHISAAIGTVDEGSIFGPLNAIKKLPSAAEPITVTVMDIRPHGDQGGGGGVEFFLLIGWFAASGSWSPIGETYEGRWDIVTDITVLDPPEDAAIVKL